jgi:hypothetical protein
MDGIVLTPPQMYSNYSTPYLILSSRNGWKAVIPADTVGPLLFCRILVLIPIPVDWTLYCRLLDAAVAILNTAAALSMSLVGVEPDEHVLPAFRPDWNGVRDSE